MDTIIFLGTAGDVETMARQQRGSGGILLTLAKNQFHLDPGPSSLLMAKLAHASTRDTVAIIATNGSLLRCNDLNATISAMTLDGIDHHGVVLASKNALELVPNHYKECVEGVMALAPQNKVGINEVTILPVKSVSKDATAVGLRLSVDHLTVGYTGDTSWYESMAKDYEGCDVLILNVKHPRATKEEGHLNLDDAERLIEAVRPKAAFLTGFGSKIIDAKDEARQLQRKTKVDVIAAEETTTTNLNVYRQKHS